ncbi:hypothetical protein DVH24_002110 [Malus domestica]|uniref:Uncharacterized protein n=1 Tax=Malus domestica TaxID=3750 RepID=A0A498I8Q0_MALDO|nr:hypothetical protein DVH24_002110 [Malus domestica]
MESEKEFPELNQSLYPNIEPERMERSTTHPVKTGGRDRRSGILLLRIQLRMLFLSTFYVGFLLTFIIFLAAIRFMNKVGYFLLVLKNRLRMMQPETIWVQTQLQTKKLFRRSCFFFWMLLAGGNQTICSKCLPIRFDCTKIMLLPYPLFYSVIHQYAYRCMLL